MANAADIITADAEAMQQITPEEAARKRKAELYSAWVQAKATEQTAPFATADAEKAYYTETEGSDGYAALVTTRNAATAQNLKKSITQAHADDVAAIDATLEDYTTTAAYAENIESTVTAQLEEVILMADGIQQRQDTRTTNNRKSAFLDIQRSTLLSTHMYLTVLIWIVAYLYAKHYVLPNPSAQTVAIFGGLVASPWVLGYLAPRLFAFVARLFGYRVYPFNVYTTLSDVSQT